MNNEQYKNLMWHLLYTESLLENIANVTFHILHRAFLFGRKVSHNYFQIASVIFNLARNMGDALSADDFNAVILLVRREAWMTKYGSLAINHRTPGSQSSSESMACLAGMQNPAMLK